ncbi:MAG TPA: ABC transporter ATP-binding protein [Candidatus Bathyarchaeia archaeon]|nr:ABC transporter ATP-binding protein [Candidatus Bathyarchaeia archaeon]
MALIECKDLVKTYGTDENAVTILHGVSFQIEKGEFAAIIGPSGSGKSTLMHILGALDTPTSGSYQLNKKNVAELDDDELADIRGRQIGFVFQAFNLLPRTTVLRNVTLPLLYQKVDPVEREKLASEALLHVDIPKEKFMNKSNQISGGQMQRVAIARALINDPSLILADEPTGNLDQKTGAIVLETFEKLNAQGRTIVLITHDQAVANRANHIIRIQDGRIVEDSKRKIAQKKVAL